MSDQTKNAYLAALRTAIEAKNYPWADTPAIGKPGVTKLDNFLARVEEMINGPINLVNLSSPSFTEAWRAIGMKGKPTYKGLRGLSS